MGEHAVVLGASMAGLLAARVLRDHYSRVTVIERDRLPALGVARTGVPQGQHAHVLLARGTQSLEAFFPGFRADLARLGARVTDVLRDDVFVFHGQRMPRQEGDDMRSVMCTRPLLEGYVLRRLRYEGGVDIRHRCEVTGLVGDFAGVRGVRLRDLERDRDHALDADLVIDATGRGSHLPSWLAELGHRRPAQERIELDLGYVSALYRPAAGKLREQLGAIISVAPPRRRAGMALAVDDERILVTLCGYLGEHPRADHFALREFARGLPSPELAQLLEGAEPVGAPVPFRFSASQRVHYEQERVHPAGAIAFGDALCSFNPVYGQGMTVAALQAELLDRLVQECDVRELPRVFYREAARIIDGAWALSTGHDLRFEEIAGPRTLTNQVMNAYFARLVSAARQHAPTARRMVRVQQLVDAPNALLGPSLIARALLVGRAPPAPRCSSRELTITRVRG